ncbi:phage tail tape measure protein [Neotabrizicola shimadae]|uniref:Phage tail tape measure protein n=1 Tax=Neotabrizicola shimadae TaxID=2807096 RepID=A0A8G1EE45_9RHOB|nr:phage tail tape measure protein [Neotabrizicola shimadae]QYZ70886.1 phage tail tape measure protein [Neotabrizicola shimadae]
MDTGKLEEELSALDSSLDQSVAMVGAFESALVRMRESMATTGQETGSMTTGFSSGLKRAMDGLVMDGMKLSDALSLLGRSMLDAAYAAALKPLNQGIANALSTGISGIVSNLLPFANGAPFAQGRVMPFAQGGVVTSPTSFPMRGGTGLMGEAGPEAIMPLARGPDGRLGVRAGGGGRSVNVVMNIQTPDVAGFERSRAQIAARAARALSQSQRIR